MIKGIARRVTSATTRTLQVISTIILVVIVAINGVNVVGRYVFSSPISWGEEVMLYLMIVGVFLAVPAVTWDGAHLRMDLLARAVPPLARRIIETLTDLISLGVAGLFVYVSVPIVLQLFAFNQRSDAAEIPVAIPQSAIPIGFALVALALIVREWSGKAAEDAARPPE